MSDLTPHRSGEFKDIPGASAFPHLSVPICASVQARLQLNPRSGISEDYFNQFYAVVALLEMCPQFLSATQVQPRIVSRIAGIPNYDDFITRRFGELDIHSLQPGLSPIDIISLARPSLGVLGRITEEVRCLGNRIEALSFPHSFRDVSQDLKLWVYLARETMSGALDCERYAGVLGIDVAQSRALLQLPPRAAA